MTKENFSLIKPISRRSFSRRGVLVGGAIAGVSGALGFSAITARPVKAEGTPDDIEVLNGALYYEHQAIWAYGFAAGALSDTEVGQAVLALALRNQADHMAHRDALASAISSLGGIPVMTEESYDLSSYLEAGEGALDSDVNIAKLALALEVDAAIAYASEVAKLTAPELVMAGASIGSTESAHATAIRAAFVSLGVDVPYVPASFVSADTREAWILKV
ncbi:MAG: ferritin-like domain-containing protein [Leptolyngbyaceae cyanobacterium SM1_4_3]|nr:ferritin-like domain-containing protein [Leptolyngbyaceae cyanobacterium SM1_4_3]